MKQITIVTNDRAGLLAEIAERLARAGINVENMDAEEFSGTAVVVISVDQHDEALRVLATMPGSAYSEDALVVRLADQPGALANISRRLADAGITMRSVRIVQREGPWCFVAIAVRDVARAQELLADVLVSGTGK